GTGGLGRARGPGRVWGDGSRLLALRPSGGRDDSFLYGERGLGRAAWRELLPGRIAASTVPRGRLRPPRGRHELRAGTAGRTEAASGDDLRRVRPRAGAGGVSFAGGGRPGCCGPDHAGGW